MRILTHNFMCSPRSKSYPLRLVPKEIETIDTTYNQGFLEHILPRLDWDVLRTTAAECGLGQLPEQAPQSANDPQSKPVFEMLHRILMEVRGKEIYIFALRIGNIYVYIYIYINGTLFF